MTTLREERRAATERHSSCAYHKREFGRGYRHGFEDALGPYGGYEVVEGNLVEEPAGAWVLQVGPGFCDTWDLSCLGSHTDHVKLLVPPKPVAERDQLRKRPKGDSFPVTSGAEQQQDEVEAVSLAVQAYVRTMMRERDQRIAELEETLELCLYELQDGRGYADEACDRVEDIVNAALRREAE